MNLNQTEFADKVGLSIGTISKIEHGKTAVSLDTLISMAQKLNVSFLSFFEGLEEKRPCHVIPSGQGIRLSRENCQDNVLHQLKGQWIYESGLTELHFVSLGCGSAPWFSRHEGWTILYALAGRFRYRHGERILLLQPGDAVHFDASCLHGPELVEQHPASYLLIRVNSSAKIQRRRNPANRS
jgi:transcriptional regulator with XRE-family HTH domain